MGIAGVKPWANSKSFVAPEPSKRTKSAIRYQNRVFDEALRDHTSATGQISLDDVKQILQKDGYLRHLPEIGSIVETNGSEEERAARLLNTLSIYLTKPVSHKPTLRQ